MSQADCCVGGQDGGSTHDSKKFGGCLGLVDDFGYIHAARMSVRNAYNARQVSRAGDAYSQTHMSFGFRGLGSWHFSEVTHQNLGTFDRSNQPWLLSSTNPVLVY